MVAFVCVCDNDYNFFLILTLTQVHKWGGSQYKNLLTKDQD